MPVPIEVTELFKLDKFTEDLKWLIYKMLWKHKYCINSELKAELLSHARLSLCIHTLKSIFKPDEFLIYEDNVGGVDIRVINYTNYYDALIYNLFSLFPDPIPLSINFVCSVTDDENIENLITISLTLILENLSHKEKMKLLLGKWNSLTEEEQMDFKEKIHTTDFNDFRLTI